MGYCVPAREINYFMDVFYSEMVSFQPVVSKHGKGATAFLWYQGESDVETPRRVLYKGQLEKMAKSLRKYADNPEMKMVIVQLSYLVGMMGNESPLWGKMRDVQRQFCVEDGKAILVPALPYSHKDPIHLGAEGHAELGARMGQALAEAHAAGKAVWQGPRAVSAKFADGSRKRIAVTFDNAKGLELSDRAIGKMHPANDEKWEDKVERRDPKEDWYVTDAKHRGQPDLLKAEIKDGALRVELEGGKIEQLQAEQPEAESLTAQLTNPGYLRPAKAWAEGTTVMLEFAEPVSQWAKVSYALYSNSRSTLMDEQGKPAAAFVGLKVEDER
jgi:hypothetical protein